MSIPSYDVESEQQLQKVHFPCLLYHQILNDTYMIPVAIIATGCYLLSLILTPSCIPCSDVRVPR